MRLADGKLSAAEAESLLDALEQSPTALPSASGPTELALRDPKYLRVLVEGYDEHEPEHGGAASKVNVCVPFTLLRAGMRLELVTHLRELSIDVEGARGEKVRVFCE